MKKFKFIALLLLFNLSLTAQIKTDTISKEFIKIEIDSTSLDTIKLPDLFVYRDNMSAQEKKDFLLLQNRVYKVYPYAKVAADRLVFLNKNLEKLKTAKEKKKYFKLVENYMENEFTDQLKKLSRKQGQILVKLIYRQTGLTTFDLIKDYKSGWKAFWSNNTAKLFDINLKTKYLPYDVNEDFLIETILDRAFTRGRLANQKVANPVDIDELTEFWEKKTSKK
jgi:predicted RNA-binding protein YlxR (DUF448 family)